MAGNPMYLNAAQVDGLWCVIDQFGNTLLEDESFGVTSEVIRQLNSRSPDTTTECGEIAANILFAQYGGRKSNA